MGLGLGLMPAPADCYGGIDADEDEEGAAAEGVEDGFGVDVGCYPAGPPVFCYEV